MKKICPFFLIFAVAFTWFTGCGGDDPGQPPVLKLPVIDQTGGPPLLQVAEKPPPQNIVPDPKLDPDPDPKLDPDPDPKLDPGPDPDLNIDETGKNTINVGLLNIIAKNDLSGESINVFKLNVNAGINVNILNTIPQELPALTADDDSAPWLFAYLLSGRFMLFGTVESPSDIIVNENVTASLNGADIDCDIYLFIRIKSSKKYSDGGHVQYKYCQQKIQEGENSQGTKFTLFWNYYDVSAQNFVYNDQCFGISEVSGHVWSPSKGILTIYEEKNGVKSVVGTSYNSADVEYITGDGKNRVTFDGAAFEVDDVLPLTVDSYLLDGKINVNGSVTNYSDYTKPPDDVVACWKWF